MSKTCLPLMMTRQPRPAALPDDAYRTPSSQLNGKRALVTGASSGIGLGCAIALAEAGAEVTCVARREGPLVETVEALCAEGWQARAWAADITSLAALDSLFVQPFDVVVNAAGLGRHASALDTKPEGFDAIMTVSHRAACFLSQRAARAMKAARKGGSIIHVSSQIGHVGGIDWAAWRTIEEMTNAMAMEFGPLDIRLNTICPTFLRTPLAESTFADTEKSLWLEQKIKHGRVGNVGDVMGAVVYLASDASARVTGSARMIDGGWCVG